MSSPSVRLPDVYIDAKTAIEGVLSESPKVSIKINGSLFSSFSDITYYHFEEVDDEEGYSNLDLILTYRMQVLSEDQGFIKVEKTRKLRVLTAIGDNGWSYRMIDKIWEGDYPSTVAVDTETGEVFFFNIKATRLELIEFSKFTDIEFETFNEEVHDREPFRIIIDPEAMFEYIDGAEGINHLRRNVLIEFNCAVPIRLSGMRLVTPV